ncbi:MAG: Zn-ribbon domain-containing OB-fold protein [Alphaproteobacteria bacterium]|jgi:hypothetical protein|nr:thiolase [Rhodospirillaceae bacterium]MDP6407386.1 Zn-ribbon domain-containing OB-fold protein [Alphaproteobacteria bacterium]MDP6622363.1 Zn-ribbon domain-containing OB-fold protein [Alphaproteobacteria bacterium]|tara:strand:- start:2317 stop:2721 length:405 start_codon:yes stop_codon:yes gene_type:complete
MVEPLLPPANEDSKPFWEALKDHRLVLQTCSKCGAVRHYPRPVCPQCHAMEADWVEASGRGKVHSWTVSHYAFHPSFKEQLPLLLGIIDLDEGVRLNCRLRDVAADQIAMGMAVEIGFEDIDDDVTVPVARPAS